MKYILKKFSPYLLKRRIKYFIQRRTRGWDDGDTWSLDFTMVQLLLPRLKRFKEVNNGHPAGLTAEQWDRYLDRMIEACELYIKHQGWFHPNMIGLKEYAKIVRGHKLFNDYFTNLWW